MKNKVTLLVLLSLAHWTIQGENDLDAEDVSPFQEAAKAILQDENIANLGGMVSSFMQSEGGKHLGDMVMSAASNNNDATSQILAGLGNVLAQNGGSGAENALNPALIGTVLGMLNDNTNAKKTARGQDKSDFDLGGFFNLLGSLADGGEGDGKKDMNLLNFLPMVISTINSFVGPEAQSREDSHKGHAWLLPPVLEKIHLLFDHFINSELGRGLTQKIGAEKFIKIFADENGRFSYSKLVELLENHNFRRHWIRLVTKRVAEFVSYFADPYTQKRFMQTVQFFVNSFLKSQGFPPAAMFNPDRPTESISSGINHLSKTLFNTKIDARKYVKPILKYVEEIFALAQEKGIIGRAVNSAKLSDKLADTINLDLIEPVVRVNRAYKFALKVPQCDRYVMCLINQDTPDDNSSLYELKKLLSKGTSIILSWFLSGQTGTSFWSLYSVISDENNCQARFVEACNDFHLEEIKVTTEYVHNEL